MKIRDGLKLQKIMDKYVAVPSGAAEDRFHGIIRLNNTAAQIWKGIEEGLDLDGIVKSFRERYPSESEDRIREDILEIMNKMKAAGLLED